MLSSSQLKASRALLGLDQAAMAAAAGVSLPTIQRMEASDGIVRAQVDSLMKVLAALDRLGVEVIGPEQPSSGRGRGVRLRNA